MKRGTSLAVGVAVMGLAAVRELRAEPHRPAAANGAPAARASLSLAARFGASSAPFYTASFPSVRGHGLVAVVAGSYPISTTEQLGLALPGALLSIEQPAGAYVDELTWGNPTLWMSHNQASDLGDGRSFRWFGRLAVSLPLAEHGAPADVVRASAYSTTSSSFVAQSSTPITMPPRLEKTRGFKNANHLEAGTAGRDTASPLKDTVPGRKSSCCAGDGVCALRGYGGFGTG